MRKAKLPDLQYRTMTTLVLPGGRFSANREFPLLSWREIDHVQEEKMMMNLPGIAKPFCSRPRVTSYRQIAPTPRIALLKSVALIFCWSWSCIAVWSNWGGITARANEPVQSQQDGEEISEQSDSHQDILLAVRPALSFLEADVAKWRAEHGCATCHHGTMTVWAFSEATKRGLAIDPEKSAEILTWTKQRFLEDIDEPRDTRPGWSMVNTPAIYLSLMSQFVDGQEAMTTEELNRIDRHLLRHQETDGSWAWSSAPPINRPPPFFESDEMATRLALMALYGREHINEHDADAIRAGRTKASDWLAQASPEETTQAVALRLMMKVCGLESAQAIQASATELLKIRNEDGGWGQLDGRPSDAYATGQALYVLQLAGMKREQEEIAAAITFLLRTQRDDGSWPMTSRAHEGAEPYKNPVPITYFGSAWATLGLMQFLPDSDQR